MKNKNIWIVVGVIVIILIAVFAWSKHSSAPAPTNPITEEAAAAAAAGNNAPTVSAPVTQTETVSGTLSKYQNDELGFSVQYPTDWAVVQNPSGPFFTIPLTSKATTISTLSSAIYVASGKCSFPQVASSTIKGTSALKVGALTYNMISVMSSEKGLNYTNRMYTLQQGTTANPLCYMFSFAAVTKSLSTANTPVIAAADAAFTAMVKSFAIVTGPAGESEASHATGR